jgi:hypothetical protein
MFHAPSRQPLLGDVGSQLLVDAVHLEKAAPAETMDALAVELEAFASWQDLSGADRAGEKNAGPTRYAILRSNNDLSPIPVGTQVSPCAPRTDPSMRC